MRDAWCTLALCSGLFEASLTNVSRRAVHGLPSNTPTWVRLFDITADLKSIVVNATVNQKWAPGAEILITSHSQRWDRQQVRKITNVSPFGSDKNYVTLQLNASLDRPTTLKESPDFAVEVALLSRNILFQGDVDAIKAHGGHFWVMNTPKVQQQIEGVDFKNFGQQGLLGRYPIHFHFCGDVSGSVVSKNTIRQSNQRCVVVHGTNKLLIQENVAFDTKGHCYIVEDGIETGNRFIRNLGALTSIPATLIPNLGSNGKETDGTPSTFWITNPSNTWIGNVAAGCINAGFWFELKLRGSKAAEFAYLDPMHDSLTSFQDNVAHSNSVVSTARDVKYHSLVPKALILGSCNTPARSDFIPDGLSPRQRSYSSRHQSISQYYRSICPRQPEYFREWGRVCGQQAWSGHRQG